MMKPSFEILLSSSSVVKEIPGCPWVEESIKARFIVFYGKVSDNEQRY